MQRNLIFRELKHAMVRDGHKVEKFFFFWFKFIHLSKTQGVQVMEYGFENVKNLNSYQ